MKNYSVIAILSLAVLFFTMLPPSAGEANFCPGAFTAKGVCASIDCGDLALFHWPASSMPHGCVCSEAGPNQSLCTCQIVC
ncbi:unnamed protein product [Cuscuta campestris]|uniref:Bifunctional inhibitor/plant lipid transfer protein/seed storage helical domain-containing protein n=1 Tax=Cuscuta campestris TaxID=132261 RepID=A0A484L595_9ASTE|nr:unnamed protein product [Cuscuta campestris]